MDRADALPREEVRALCERTTTFSGPVWTVYEGLEESCVSFNSAQVGWMYDGVARQAKHSGAA